MHRLVSLGMVGSGLVVSLALAFGCSEGGTGDAGSGAAGGSASTQAGGGGSGGGGGHGGNGSGGKGGGGPGGSTTTGTAGGGGAGTSLVINEISASGDDWFEIANPTGDSVSLAGLVAADADDNGQPNLSKAVTFGPGNVIEPHGYVLVLGGQDDDENGAIQTKCLGNDGPASCFYATWKISASSGETVFLLDGAMHVLDSAVYPPDAVADGQTWGRLPDATGAFVPNKPTPGAPNLTP